LSESAPAVAHARDRTHARSALVLFAHGSRDPQWAEPFRAIQRKVAAKRPALCVELAFLQLMQPTLEDTVDRLTKSGCVLVTIAPLFMAEGAHLKRDLAELLKTLQARYADVELRLLPAAGETDEVLEAISAWLTACA
jgi:sirohydrochlorin cobaltochelatase